MQLTPAIKGQLTKAVNAANSAAYPNERRQFVFRGIRRVFQKVVPAEQAKHAARRYLTAING